MTILPLSTIFILGLLLTSYGLYMHWKMERSGVKMEDGAKARAKYVALSYLVGLGIVFMALSGTFLYGTLFPS